MLQRSQIKHSNTAIGSDTGENVLASGKGQIKDFAIVRNQLRPGRLCFNVPNSTRRINGRRPDNIGIRFVPIKASERRTVFRRFVVVEQAFLAALDRPASHAVILNIPNAKVVSRGG
jgi:hypothetical protein